MKFPSCFTASRDVRSSAERDADDERGDDERITRRAREDGRAGALGGGEREDGWDQSGRLDPDAGARERFGRSGRQTSRVGSRGRVRGDIIVGVDVGTCERVEGANTSGRSGATESDRRAYM